VLEQVYGQRLIGAALSLAVQCSRPRPIRRSQLRPHRLTSRLYYRRQPDLRARTTSNALPRRETIVRRRRQLLTHHSEALGRLSNNQILHFAASLFA